MPTVHDLIYLNRDFRKLLETGLERASPFPPHCWPLLYLAVKIARHQEALEVLALRDFGSEGGIILRSMFEAAANILWISKDPAPRLTRFVAFLAFDSQKYRDASQKWDAMSHLSAKYRQRIEQEFEQLKKEAKQIGDEFGFKSYEHWSGLSLKTMCKEIGWLERYDFLYKTYSDVSHSNIISSNKYLKFSESGVRLNREPQGDECAMCLCEAYYYLWASFSFLDIFLNLGMESMLEHAYSRIPKT
ncbi:DUF5677 domain-containing protein [Dehalogenimonas formicexedens]|nr:DUF5677 domain-containing protein [Dehalogenimonas formicexedens]